MTTKRRQDPYRSFNFALELDGRAIAGFSDVSGLNGDVTVLEHRTGTEPATATRKLPGLHKFTNITLKRGVANGSTLYAWQTSGAAGRRPATVVLRDEAGQPVCSLADRQGINPQNRRPDPERDRHRRRRRDPRTRARGPPRRGVTTRSHFRRHTPPLLQRILIPVAIGVGFVTGSTGTRHIMRAVRVHMVEVISSWITGRRVGTGGRHAATPICFLLSRRFPATSSSNPRTASRSASPAAAPRHAVSHRSAVATARAGPDEPGRSKRGFARTGLVRVVGTLQRSRASRAARSSPACSATSGRASISRRPPHSSRLTRPPSCSRSASLRASRSLPARSRARSRCSPTSSLQVR